ncbi:MAG TPA: VOC family protein [Thermoanaerobaculia bacterium]|nr:VOC family protein [Thermoanaerobaculia bacterium]
MRLRQVVLVAGELEPSADLLRHLFGLGSGYRDPGVGEFGLENVVFALGDTFLEIVSPVEDGTAAGRYLERRGGDGGYMVILQVEDMEETRRYLAELGVRVVWRSDHDDIEGTHLHPRDVGGAILSLDEAMPPASWRWAGPTWKEEGSAANARAVTGVELQSDTPEALAARWGEILRLEPESIGGGLRIALDGGELRFVEARDGRGEGVCGFDVVVGDRRAVERAAAKRGLAVERDVLECCGVRFLLT